MYALLVVAFGVQTCLVYFDPLHAHSEPLSASARLGLSIWRENNCQVCHQIHGFGGFLGPDLTNLVSRRPDEDFTDVLVEGRRQMPAFGFDEGQREAIMAFLTEVDRTGRSIPVLAVARREADWDRLLPEYSEAERLEPPADVRRGDALMRLNRCGACHVPFATGLRGSPDPTTLMSRTTRAQAAQAILRSKGVMPGFPHLREHDAQDMVEALLWMNRRRPDLGAFWSGWPREKTLRWRDVPWFEYPEP